MNKVWRLTVSCLRSTEREIEIAKAGIVSTLTAAGAKVMSINDCVGDWRGTQKVVGYDVDFELDDARIAQTYDLLSTSDIAIVRGCLALN